LNAGVAKRAIVTAALLLLGAFLIVGGIIQFAQNVSNPVSAAVGVLLALGLLELVRRTEAAFLLRVLDGLRFFLPIVAFLLTMELVGDSTGTVPFDEVAAQIIAVFLLALALEARFFRLHRVREPLDLAGALFTILMLGSGEFYALQGIASERPLHANLIGGAIAAGFVAVAITALTGPGVDPREDRA
jgi:hypothetical protein